MVSNKETIEEELKDELKRVEKEQKEAIKKIISEEKTKKGKTEEKIICCECKTEIKETEKINLNDKFYCKKCSEIHLRICENCEEYIFRNDALYFDGTPYCEECYNETFVCCDCCGESFYSDDVLYNDDDGYICVYCNEDNENGNNNFEVIKIPLKKTISKTFKENKFKNNCGFEIEAINDNLNENQFTKKELIKYGFSQIPDGSLSKGGVEFVSDIFNGDLLNKKIKTFTEELKKRDYKINSSCGFHIHIAVPKKIDFLKKVYLFYSKYEDLFFKMLPKSRALNRYCYPFKNGLLGFNDDKVFNFNDCLDFQKLLYETKSKYRITNAKKDKYHYKRYNWVNFHSVFYRGTLEIRNHSGTINPEKIKNWFNIHLTILDLIKNLNEKTINQLPKTEEFFLTFFNKNNQDYIKSRWLNFQDIKTEEDN